MREELSGASQAELELRQFGISVHNETDPLIQVAVWGPPGSEAALAQLLPADQNLFFSEFDVVAARTEYQRMLDFLGENGVDVVVVQDLLLQNGRKPSDLDNHHIPQTKEQLLDDLFWKAVNLHEKYGIGNLKATTDILPELLVDDFERLGEQEAIYLNWMLSLRHNQPSGDIFYGRDQTNVLGDTMVYSSMRWPIRKPEVGMYKGAFDQVLNGQKTHRIRGDNAYLEGGDGIMVNGDIYMGVGGRTNLSGATYAFRGLEHQLTGDKRMLLVVNEEEERLTRVQTKPGQEMGAMHLDTFWMPFGPDKDVLCCMEVAERRVVKEVVRGGDNNHITLVDRGDFPTFMSNEGFRVHDIPSDEQQRYATNFLSLGPDKAIVAFSDNTTAMSHLEGANITTLPVEMTALGGGYGAIHCMTSALKRVPK
ncbi:MAG: arginine deiminase family protein [bacterium]|nr:arginine deiminase family protein [bacterium]